MMKNIFTGCLPALMTPSTAQRRPNFAALVKKGQQLIDAGMNGVIYCGSMGDWPLLTDAERQQGVAELVAAEIPVVVGTGAVNTATAVEHVRHAVEVDAAGLMVIPRVLSRGTSPIAQRHHFAAILQAAQTLPAVIYNSPYYGFQTKADLFYDLRAEFPNLVGFKEFGGAASLSYAAEHITSGNAELTLMVGVDTQVFHGFIRCGATGAITGIGNALPEPVLYLIRLCEAAVTGDAEALRWAGELSAAFEVLSTFDEGADLVLYYKYLLELDGDQDYHYHFNPTDELTASQRGFVSSQYQQFKNWWDRWPGRSHF